MCIKSFSNQYIEMGFEVVMVISIMLVLSWVLTLCDFVGQCQSFGEAC
jgi:hypothetical protein